jgi:FHA domain
MTDSKPLLKRAGEAIRTAAETTKTWFDPPLAADAEPLEIREAIIDDVERRVEPVEGGRRVLPFNRITIVVRAPNKTERARLEAALSDMRDAIHARLREIQCPLPKGFEIAVSYTKRPRPEWTENQRIAIDYDAHQPEPEAAAAPGGVPQITIEVIRGTATESSYTLTGPQVHIGRTPKPVDRRGRPRLNHVVFVEGADEHSNTVGRAHASIRYDADRREYRLFDDGSHNGTRVIRETTTIDVDARDPTGVILRTGDEVEFGTAAVKIEVGSKPRDESAS